MHVPSHKREAEACGILRWRFRLVFAHARDVCGQWEHKPEAQAKGPVHKPEAQAKGPHRRGGYTLLEMILATLDAGLLARERALPNYMLRTRRPELFAELLRDQVSS